MEAYIFGELNGEYPLLSDIICNLKIPIPTLLLLLIISKSKQGCILVKLIFTVINETKMLLLPCFIKD
jgi:hypothetical protein